MRFTGGTERLGEVDSTMHEARLRALAGAPAGTVVVARSQRAGRGRLGRPWFAPPDASLLATFVLRPQPRPDGSALTLAGLVCGLAACDAARALGAAGAQLKWPNDVVVAERKLCGILIEAEDVAGPSPLVLAGFGFNLAARDSLELPEDVQERYVGLADLVPAPAPTVERALGALRASLSQWYGRWLSSGSLPVLEAYALVDSLRGLEVTAEAPSGPVSGRADGVAADGALRIATAAGITLVTAGDVTRVRAAFPLETRGPRP
jgi:BirA family biotin operon repressor/biotin-[acetyl-CoA-carboxylase] ligase